MTGLLFNTDFIFLIKNCELVSFRRPKTVSSPSQFKDHGDEVNSLLLRKIYHVRAVVTAARQASCARGCAKTHFVFSSSVHGTLFCIGETSDATKFEQLQTITRQDK